MREQLIFISSFDCSAVVVVHDVFNADFDRNIVCGPLISFSITNNNVGF